MCLQLAMSTNKQKKRRLLPNLEEMQLLLSQDKATVKVVEDAFCSLKHTKNLNSIASERLTHVDRDAIFTWLIAHYGSKDLFSIMQRIEDLPKSLTKYQAIALLKQSYGRITENDLATIFTLLTEYCSDHVSNHSEAVHDIVKVMAPPTRTCYECGSSLTAYHNCEVRYYTCTQATIAKKFTLQCTRCSLIYNYAQFGNKNHKGFCFYPNARPAIEVTDTVFFDRQLLEWQCALA